MVQTKMQKETVKELLKELNRTSGVSSLEKVAEFLGYTLRKNAVDPTSDWYFLSHPELDENSQAFMAVIFDDELTPNTAVKELRKRYDVMEKEKEKWRGFEAFLFGFIGKGRILLFRAYDSHRDERLDISEESIQKVSLYADNFYSLHVDHITIQEDEFGFGKTVTGLEQLFKKDLSKLFHLTIQLYRKQIAELIVTTPTLEQKVLPLLPNQDRRKLKNKNLRTKLLNTHYKQAIGSIIDTIVLRTILRRFLEGYHGLEAFSAQDDLKDIGLGKREGKMDDIIQYLADVEHKKITERNVQQAIKKGDDGQLTWELFDSVSFSVTPKNVEVTFQEIYRRLRKQFEIAYGGDLFSSDISDVVNEVEEEINRTCPKLLLKLLVDISGERFNFRYEDLPPEMIQDFYEDSMGNSLHYRVNNEGEAIVTYSLDLQERKQKGAYYTPQKLVDYMVEKTVGKKLEELLHLLKEKIKENNVREIEKVLTDIIHITIIDITCGGGSFLRGAFRFLSSKQDTIARILRTIEEDMTYDYLIKKFPYFQHVESNPEAKILWEKHILLHMIYGIDIDYKALIISSQTLTLSAIHHWKIGTNFPKLIGLTLMQQNALIGPVRVEERKEVFQDYKEEIKELIRLRMEIRGEEEFSKADILTKELNQKRLALQNKLNERIEHIIPLEYREALLSESIEVNFPEIFFDENGELKEDAGFTISIGNPPWESWKSIKDEFYSVYDQTYRSLKGKKKEKLEHSIQEKYPEMVAKQEWLKDYFTSSSDYFLQHDFYQYQRVKVNNRFTSSDINLYKIATEKNYQILNRNGMCSYLLPSSVYTDEGATGIRKMLFEYTELQEIASFENRKKIFKDIDSRTKFAAITFLKGGETKEFRAFFYKHYLDALYKNDEFIKIPKKAVEGFSPFFLSVLEFREQKEVYLIQKMANFPFLSKRIEDKWNIELSSGFHMTHDKGLFNEESEGNPLFEGKHIWHYTHEKDFQFNIKDSVGRDVLEKKEKKRIKQVNKKYKLPTNLPIYEDYFRIAYRAVSSSTNKRTLISTILPKNVYCGHSLNFTKPYSLFSKGNEVIRIPNYSLKEIVVITALFNSFVADFILRRKITTNVTMNFMNELPIPRLTEKDTYFHDIMIRAAKLICVGEEYEEIRKETGIDSGVEDEETRQLLQNQIDAYVANIYGLTREELIYILSTFESVNHQEEIKRIAQGIIEQFDILIDEGGLVCPE